MKEMSYEDFERVCDTCSQSEPEDLKEKLKMKCTRCSWMDDKAKDTGVYRYRSCGKYCNCFCHVVAPHFNGTSAATHLRAVIIEQESNK